MQDLVSVVAQSWPDWCDVVASEFAELLPLDVRIKYFQGTALSRARVSKQSSNHKVPPAPQIYSCPIVHLFLYGRRLRHSARL
jgi:hypothetical protein